MVRFSDRTIRWYRQVEHLFKTAVQPQPVITDSFAVLSDRSEEDYQALCKQQALETVGTESLAELQAYCHKYCLNQTTWSNVFKDVFNRVFFGALGTASAFQMSVIADEIKAESDRDEKICNQLRIEIIDLEIEYGEIAFPANTPSLLVYYKKELITSLVHSNVYHTTTNNISFDNPYTAALSYLNKFEISIAKAEIKKENFITKFAEYM
jgi:hypothetical protein